MSFIKFTKLTLVSIFLIIVAGGVVRMTGSGMGCPDWPKCFGLIVPPTNIEQLQWMPEKEFARGQMIIRNEQLWSAKNHFKTTDVYNKSNWELYTKHNYATFNPAHTWTEYVNRLVGAISGILTFIMLLKSFSYWNSKRKIVYLSTIVVLLMGFQGWLGAVVVYSVLQPIQITIHMLMALLIVAVMVYLIYEIPNEQKQPQLNYDTNFARLLFISLGLTVLQIAFGTQVRQAIDEIALSLDHNHRELWTNLAGNTFKFHRSFAILLVLTNGLLFIRNYKLNLGYKMVNWVLFVLCIEVLSGILLTYLDMLALMQPIHLVFASLLFVIQIALYFQLKQVRGLNLTKSNSPS